MNTALAAVSAEQLACRLLADSYRCMLSLALLPTAVYSCRLWYWYAYFVHYLQSFESF